MFTSTHPTLEECRQEFASEGICNKRAEDFFNYYAQRRWLNKHGYPIDIDIVFRYWVEHTDAQFYLSNRKVETPREPLVANQQTLLPQVIPRANESPREPPYRQWRTYTNIVQKLRYRDFLTPKEKRLMPRYRQYWSLFGQKYPHKRIFNIHAV